MSCEHGYEWAEQCPECPAQRAWTDTDSLARIAAALEKIAAVMERGGGSLRDALRQYG